MSDFEPISGYSKNRTSTVFENSNGDSQRGEFTFGLSDDWSVEQFDAEKTSVLATNGTDEQRAVVVWNLNGEGGSGGTTNYDQLSNKPSINDITLQGNKTSADLGLQPEIPVIDITAAKVISENPIKVQFTAEDDLIINTAENPILVIDATSVNLGVITVSKSRAYDSDCWLLSQIDGNENVSTGRISDIKAEVIIYDPETKIGTYENVTLVKEADIVDNLTTTSTDKPLSANMGKTLQDQVTNLKNIGRFLSIWNSATGQPTTNPEVMPYTYKTGDYYRVGTVAAEGGTNYKPNGTTYTGQASTTVETEEVEIGAVYYYDGTAWMMQKSGSGGKVQDVQINGTTILDLDSGVANIPVAGNDLGVVKTTLNGSGGLSISSLGGMYVVGCTSAELEAKTQLSKPITPSTVDKAVMEGLGNNSLTWTDAYKTSAQTTIGINTEQFVFTMADNSTVTKNIKVSA